ncbi:hypothetical protein [Pseudoalteromonas byunsanensis]|nr:hypothetical protein [Pseudoalteromonas byunsanensis]
MRIILFLLLVFLSNSALACRCGGLSDEEYFYQAEEVLLVQVLATELIEGEKDSDSKVKVGFRVLETFKKSDTPSKFVYTGLSNCSPHIRAGYKYVFYIPNNKVVSTCTGSYNILTHTRYGKEKLAKLREQEAI